MVYGMRKTTLYVPDSLKARISRIARLKGRSEAAVIRDALLAYVTKVESPSPRLPLFESGQPTLSEEVDELLSGFGEA